MSSKECVDKYIDQMRKIQSEIINTINAEGSSESPEKLVSNLKKYKISSNNDIFRSFLHLISIIYENHHQNHANLRILEKVILDYKKDILNNFQNSEIFTIFKNDKRILLFLLNSQILKIDKFVMRYITDFNDLTYFYPEVKDFLDKYLAISIETLMTNDFLENRENGENHSYICKLIRNDSIDKFVIFLSQTNMPLSYEIEFSLFETNPFLIGKNPKLIEYAAFFGSIQIFKYLLANGVKLTESLWPYAIHGRNLEILQILEVNGDTLEKDSYNNFFIESIKCHNNDIANYIYDNYIIIQEEENNSDTDNDNNNDNTDNNNDNDDGNTDYLTIYLQSYNFEYIKTEFINYSNFIDLCTYDYTFFVEGLMKNITPEILNKKINQNNDEGNIYKCENSEVTALYNAIYHNNNEIAKILLSNDDIDVNYNYRFTVTAYFNQALIYYDFLIMFFISLILSMMSSFFITTSIILMLLVIDDILNKLKDVLGYQYSLHSLLNIVSISDNSIEYLYNELTVLILACSNRNTEIVKLLLSKKDIDVNAMYKNYSDGKIKETALTLALKNDDDEIVKNLLANPNINVNIAYKYSSPRVITDLPLLFLYLSLFSNKICIAFGCLSLLIKLYQNKYKVIKILAIGILIGFILPTRVYEFIGSICEKLIKSEIISLSSVSQLLNSCEILGMTIVIIELLSSLLYQFYKEKSPLQIAIENNNVGDAKLLLENKNINVNFEYKTCDYNFMCNPIEELSTSKTALYMAAEIDNAEIVELLLSFNNIDVDARCKTSSHKRIIKLSNDFIFVYAIESFICLFFESHSNKSTLEIATENKSKEILELLQKFMARNQLKQ